MLNTRLNVIELIRPLADQGLSVAQVYKSLKTQYPAIRSSVVYRAAKKLNVKLDSWKPEEVQVKRIRKMVANGLPAEYIAKVMGVEVYQIYNLSHRKIDETSPYVKNKKINRETYTDDELAEMYLKVSRTMLKRFANYSEDVPSAVGDAIIELQNKPKSARPYEECFGIAQRRLIDQLRARKGRTGSRRQEIKISGFAENFDPETLPDGTLEIQDEIDWLRLRIAEMPEPDRKVIQAYLDSNLNYAATARVLGVSEPTAAKYVQAALKRLKDGIE